MAPIVAIAAVFKAALKAAIKTKIEARFNGVKFRPLRICHKKFSVEEYI